MKQVFDEVLTLDKRCYEQFGLSEDLLMENAAMGLKKALFKKIKKGKKVLIVSGPGNNGADGIALARMINGDMDVALYLPYGAKSPMAKLQLQRAKKIGVKQVDEICKVDAVVDALFGSGLGRELDEKAKALIEELNSLCGYKIACDIPTGIDSKGNISSVAFKADITVAMGALKISLLSDFAKEYVGKVRVADLGVSRRVYESKSDTFLLQKCDLKLPKRVKKSSNKGDFGHLSVLCGDKKGACIIASKAAFRFGAGVVTVINKRNMKVPDEIMQSKTMPKSVTAVCAGMGLGKKFDKESLLELLARSEHPLICDADLFYQDVILDILKNKKELVLTPHPKEFASLLKIIGFADVSAYEVQQRRFELAREFSARFKDVVLVLKGANTIIAQNKKLYICTMGTNTLSKGGSGDVLGGMIGSLLAQRYLPFDAAITAVLAHSLSAKRFKGTNFSLTPQDLIEGIKWL